MARSPSPLKILAAAAAWRMFGTRASAERLLDAMAGDDESARMLAGISLVRSGQRSFDLIERKVDAGEASAAALRLLPDIDETRARTVMDRVVVQGPEHLRAAAADCIDLLDRIAASEEDGA